MQIDVTTTAQFVPINQFCNWVLPQQVSIQNRGDYPVHFTAHWTATTADCIKIPAWRSHWIWLTQSIEGLSVISNGWTSSTIITALGEEVVAEAPPVPRNWLEAEYLLATNSLDTSGNWFDWTDTLVWYFAGYASLSTSSYISLWNVLNWEYTQPFTKWFWHKTTDNWANKHIFSKQNQSWVNQWTWIEMNNWKYWIWLYNATSATDNIRLETVSTFNDGDWHYVTFTYDWSGSYLWVTVYVDWVSVSTSLITYTWTITNSILNSESLQINWRWTSTDSTMECGLAKLRVYDRVLDLDEIEILYWDWIEFNPVWEINTLIVAWGGWAWAAAWAWGGGGGVIKETSIPIWLGSYTVTVGTWWLWSSSSSLQWDSGTNSLLFSYLAVWGGGGGSNLNSSGLNGWSGGWNWGTWNPWIIFWLWTSLQWNNWGVHALTAPAYWSGGGGGAGSVWANWTGTTWGNGWDGIADSISGSSVYYGWGGGGSTYDSNWTAGLGWLGWGWNGNISWSWVNWVDWLWWGGGWNGSDWAWNPLGNWGNGGSWVVIISYTTWEITATGGTITTSGGNTIHTFTSNGTFTVS